MHIKSCSSSLRHPGRLGFRRFLQTLLCTLPLLYICINFIDLKARALSRGEAALFDCTVQMLEKLLALLADRMKPYVSRHRLMQAARALFAATVVVQVTSCRHGRGRAQDTDVNMILSSAGARSHYDIASVFPYPNPRARA